MYAPAAACRIRPRPLVLPCDEEGEAAPGEWDPRAFARRIRAELARDGCTDARRTGKTETCGLTVPARPDWAGILARIDELDAWTLANPAPLDPPLRGGMDGTTLVVEVRDGDPYRSYAYGCPTLSSGVPEVRRAAELASLFAPFFERAREGVRRESEARERQARSPAERTR